MAIGGVNSWDLEKNLNGVNGVDTNVNTGEVAGTEATDEAIDLSSDVKLGDEEAIAKDLAEAEEGLEAGETEGAEGTEGTTGTQGPVSSSSLTPQGEQSQKVKEEMEALEKEKAENIDKMEKIEDEINTLSDKAAENIAAAVAAQENAIDQNKEESKAAVNEQLQAYIAANKEGGEGMTREELQSNIKGAVPGDPALGDALSAAVEASEQLSQVDSLLGDLNGLIQDTQGIEKELECKAGEFEAAVKADEAAKEAEKKSCDPIGFVAGEGEDAVQYDFFTDKDGDGDLSQTNEFLGADNQWAEMQAADLDQDGKVTAEELEECKISLKGSDGSVISTAEEYAAAFGEDFSIDLNSYEEGGEHSAVDPNADSDGDGVADQELLGTFNVNANGESIKGYNTLDDVDWLSENYGVEISEDAEASTQQIDTSTLSEDLKTHGDFYNFAFERNEAQKEELKEAQSKFNLTDETVNELQSTIAKEAGEKAAAFIKGLDATKEESDETVAVEGEEEVSTEPTDLGTDSATDENPFEIDEELLVA